MTLFHIIHTTLSFTFLSDQRPSLSELERRLYSDNCNSSSTSITTKTAKTQQQQQLHTAMGNANPLAVMAGKGAANETVDQAKDGFNALTSQKTAEQLAQQERAKDRVAEYEQKKREREERKKKLTGQWVDHKKPGN